MSGVSRRVGSNIVPFRPHARASLPPASIRRWTPYRKAQVLAAVRGGQLSLAEAGRRYAPSAEEFQAWARAYDAQGVPGLRTTRTQERRSRE